MGYTFIRSDPGCISRIQIIRGFLSVESGFFSRVGSVSTPAGAATLFKWVYRIKYLQPGRSNTVLALIRKIFFFFFAALKTWCLEKILHCLASYKWRLMCVYGITYHVKEKSWLKNPMIILFEINLKYNLNVMISW